MQLKPEEFSQELQKGTVGSLYCLYGEEPYLVERGVKRLMDLALPPDARDFNLAIFYGKECKGEEVADAVQTFPMFADRRVVLVKRCSELSAAALEALLPVVQNPVATSCLILQGEKVDQRLKFHAREPARVDDHPAVNNTIVHSLRRAKYRRGERIVQRSGIGQALET